MNTRKRCDHHHRWLYIIIINGKRRTSDINYIPPPTFAVQRRTLAEILLCRPQVDFYHTSFVLATLLITKPTESILKGQSAHWCWCRFKSEFFLPLCGVGAGFFLFQRVDGQKNLGPSPACTQPRVLSIERIGKKWNQSREQARLFIHTCIVHPPNHYPTSYFALFPFVRPYDLLILLYRQSVYHLSMSPGLCYDSLTKKNGVYRDSVGKRREIRWTWHSFPVKYEANVGPPLVSISATTMYWLHCLRPR